MRFPAAALVLAALLLAAPAGTASSSYQTDFLKWRAADGGFAGWTLDGATLTPGGALTLDLATARPGTDPYAPGAYYGGNYYNGGSYLFGEATSPVTSVTTAFTEAIASWNASTPAATWVETEIRADLGSRFTKWYNLGIWASGGGTIQRHSVRLQGDPDGFVSVDTFVLSAKKAAATGFQLRLRLFSADGASSPSVENVSLALSTTPSRPGTLGSGDPSRWNVVLPVPECSQMVYPGEGGEVWCSPTSTSMVLGYWQGGTGPCEPRVRAAVAGVFDWIYDGHGNWPFNTAYAAANGLEGYVARFTSMAQVEAWIAAGVPVVISYAWKKSTLTGAPIASSNGHLAVVVGFDGLGNPIVNDPAAASDADVQRTYDRTELETLWLESSGGTVYLVYPSGHAVPPL